MKKILIVDDEPHVALVLKQFLERTGLEVFTALNGKLAINLIEKEHPQVIVTDIQMPQMDGLELCETIRQTMPAYHPLIVLMIPRSDRYTYAGVEQQGHIVMMEKPLSVWRLLLKINEHSARLED